MRSTTKLKRVLLNHNVTFSYGLDGWGATVNGNGKRINVDGHKSFSSIVIAIQRAINGDNAKTKIDNMNLFDGQQGAEFSPCGKYRYKLWRIWDETLPKAMCIGLNPSTANVSANDNTINTLIAVLSKLGYGGFYMMNLYAWVSPHPEDLLRCENPIGENEGKLKEVEAVCEDVIVCFGAFKQAAGRAVEILNRYPKAKCFGKNKDGTPFHPRAMIYKKGMLKNPQLFNYWHTPPAAE